MIWDDNFFILKLKVSRDQDDYELKILINYHIFFESYSSSYVDLADQKTLRVLSLVMNDVSFEKLKSFTLANREEISKEDKDFVLKIMKLVQEIDRLRKSLLKRSDSTKCEEISNLLKLLFFTRCKHQQVELLIAKLCEQNKFSNQ